MRAVFGGSIAGATKTEGQILQQVPTKELSERKQSERPDRNVRRINGHRIRFSDLARFAWPDKTKFHLAHLTRVDPRTCQRWLDGQNEPPAEALGIILNEIMRCFNRRD